MGSVQQFFKLWEVGFYLRDLWFWRKLDSNQDLWVTTRASYHFTITALVLVLSVIFFFLHWRRRATASSLLPSEKWTEKQRKPLANFVQLAHRGREDKKEEYMWYLNLAKCTGWKDIAIEQVRRSRKLNQKKTFDTGIRTQDRSCRKPPSLTSRYL